MRAPNPRSGGFWFPALLAAVAGALLYAGNLDRPFDAPDLQLIQIGTDAVRATNAHRIWLEPLPADRADLGIYRPIHGLLLRIEYAFGPASPRGFHITSLVLFFVFCVLCAAFTSRVVDTKGLATGWIAAASTLAVAAHPMATESVNWAWGQQALLCGIGWVGALLAYQLALEGRLSWYFAAPIVAFAYFIAFGAFEAGILLPLALIAVDGLYRMKALDDRHDIVLPSRAFRFFVYGLALLAVAALLVALRWKALDGTLFPKESMRELGEPGPAMRLMQGITFAGVGLLRLLIPWRPSFFYSARYSDLPTWEPWVGFSALVLLAITLGFAAKRNRVLTLGLLLLTIPLASALQLFPLTQAFSEQLLLLSLPGFGIVVAEAARAIASRAASPRAAGLACAAAVALIFAPITMMRNHEWADSSKLWAQEANMHPTHPGPITYQMIDLISRSKRDFDLPAIADKTEAALKLANPPDADLVYQYLAVMRVEQRNAESLRTVINEAMAAPGPHAYGFYAAMGIAAFRLGLADAAEPPLNKELETDPAHFGALLTLGQIAMVKGDYNGALERARAATKAAPRFMEAQAFFLRGAAAAELNILQEGQLALSKAIELDPTLEKPYIALARLFVKNQDYQRAERVLVAARDKANVATYRDLFAVQVESLEKQGKQVAAFDFLHEMTRQKMSDLLLQLYAARYYLDHKQFRPAHEIYVRILSDRGAGAGVAADALVGMGKLDLIESGNASQAEQRWRQALSIYPGHAEATKLLEELKKRQGQPEQPAEPPLK